MTKYVSHTNGSFHVHILEEDDFGSSGSSGSTGGIGKRAVNFQQSIGFFHVIGPGDVAFYRLIKQCTSQSWNTLAKFDCGGDGGYDYYSDY